MKLIILVSVLIYTTIALEGLGDGKCASAYCRPEVEACRAAGKSCSDHVEKCAGKFALSVRKGQKTGRYNNVDTGMMDVDFNLTIFQFDSCMREYP